jgi:hypothetical protein
MGGAGGEPGGAGETADTRADIDGGTNCTPGLFTLGGLPVPLLPVAPSFIAIEDLNSDGKADLVTLSSADTVSISLGHGDGTFAEASLFKSGSQPSSVAIGDLNADAMKDLVVSNAGADTISVFMGLGGGALAARVDYPVGKLPGSVGIGDTNGDGHVDVAVTDTDADTVSVLLGKGDGSLAQATAYAVGERPQVLVMGDLDADGRADIAVQNRDSTFISLLFGQKDGSFTSRALEGSANSVVMADVDADGSLDLVSANGEAARVWLNRGNRVFGPSVDYPIGPAIACPSYNLTAGDMNADGRPDLALLNDDCTDVTVLLNRGDGTFTAPDLIDVGDYPLALVAGDLNGDQRADLALSAGYTHVTILLAQADGSFKPDWFVDEYMPVAAVASGDFNRDGRPDMVAVDVLDSTASVLFGQADGTLVAGAPISTGEISAEFSAVDIDGNGELDLAYVVSGSPSTMNVLLNKGHGSFAAPVQTRLDRRPLSRCFGDLDGDGDADFVVSTFGANDLFVFINQGGGSFAARASFATDEYVTNIALGDLNADGKLDLVLSSSTPHSVRTMLGNGDGTFGIEMDTGNTGAPDAVAVADVNGDAIDDLIVLQRQSSSVGVLNSVGVLLGGKGFPSAWLDSQVDFFSERFAGIADIDGDGATDLAVMQSGSMLFIVRGRGDGTFGASLGYSVIHVSLFVWADFDGNGRLDLGTPEVVNGVYRWNVYGNYLCR